VSTVAGVVFLTLAVLLAGGGSWLLIRGYRRAESMQSLLGLLLLLAAGFPAAVVGALSS
jgi:hypothetical protein